MLAHEESREAEETHQYENQAASRVRTKNQDLARFSIAAPLLAGCAGCDELLPLSRYADAANGGSGC